MLGMIIFKGVAGMTLIGSSWGIGLIKGRELTNRIKDTQELQRILIMLESEIAFKRNNLLTAFRNILEKTDHRGYSVIFKEVLQTIMEEHVDPCTALKQVLQRQSLMIDEKILKEFKDLFKNIGTTDAPGEIQNIQSIQKNLEILEREFRTYNEKYGKIYNASGGLVGTLITLLLV